MASESVQSEQLGPTRTWLLRPEELVLAAALACGIAVCNRIGGEIALLDLFVTYFRFMAAQGLWLLLVLGILALILKRVTQSFSGRPSAVLHAVFGARRNSRDLLITYHELIRGMLLFALTLAVYTNIKIRVPLFNSTIGDSWFAYVDGSLFGDLADGLETWARESNSLSDYLSDIYFGGYRGIVILAIFLVIRFDARVIRVLFVSMALTYLVCIVVTSLYPSLGPCFFEPDRFHWIQNSAVIDNQERLWTFREHVVESGHLGQEFMAIPFMGIAAFPSLHVGNLIVVAVLSLRYCKLALPIVLYYLIGTILAATCFGWHYIIDYFGGALFAIAITLTVDKHVP